MSNAEIIYAAVVLFVGIPAARWNWTAAALVMCYVFMQGSYYGLGLVYPTHVSVLADLTVIAVIFAKAPICDFYPYADWKAQLAACWLERSFWDRVILALFPVGWCVYASGADPWWPLWTLSLAQFLLAGGEAVESWVLSRRAARSVVSRESESKFRRLSALARVFQFIKSPKVLCSAIHPYGRQPFTDPALPADASDAALVRAGHLQVPHVRGVRDIAQIRDTIIRLAAVDVVNVIRWPLAVINRPRHPVRQEDAAHDIDLMIAAAVVPRARLFSRPPRVKGSASAITSEKCPRTLAPKEPPGLRLIAEKLTHGFGRWYRMLSHGAVPSHWGQGRALLTQRNRPDFHSEIPLQNQTTRSAKAGSAKPENTSGTKLVAAGGGYG